MLLPSYSSRGEVLRLLNNVVITGSSGFNTVGRPYYYEE